MLETPPDFTKTSLDKLRMWKKMIPVTIEQFLACWELVENEMPMTDLKNAEFTKWKDKDGSVNTGMRRKMKETKLLAHLNPHGKP